MQNMLAKGLLKRDTTVQPQVVRTARPRQQTRKLLLRDLLDRAFDGSSGPLVLQALSMQKSTRKERRKILEMLDGLEQGTRPSLLDSHNRQQSNQTRQPESR